MPPKLGLIPPALAVGIAAPYEADVIALADGMEVSEHRLAPVAGIGQVPEPDLDVDITSWRQTDQILACGEIGDLQRMGTTYPDRLGELRVVGIFHHHARRTVGPAPDHRVPRRQIADLYALLQLRRGTIRVDHGACGQREKETGQRA